jgi:hypothetical protein
MDKDMFLQLFKSLVRSHLEYGSTVWSVANKKEAIIIEISREGPHGLSRRYNILVMAID